MIAIRATWLATVVALSQQFAGALAFADPEDARTLVKQFAESLDPPPDRFHNLVLATLLLETALRVSDYLHEDVPRNATCACEHVSVAGLRSLVRWQEFDARQSFTRWADEFFRAYRRHHPATPVARAARMMRRQPERTWTLAQLSHSVGEPVRRLARAFRHEYGMGTRAYAHVARMHALLPHLSAGDKVDTLALDAGYRSKKDFYRIVRQTLQTTPRRLRRLPRVERLALQKKLRARLLNPRGIGRSR